MSKALYAVCDVREDNAKVLWDKKIRATPFHRAKKHRTVTIETRTLQAQASSRTSCLEMDTHLQLPIEKKNFVTISGFWIVVHPVIWPKNLCGSKNISPEVMDIYLADKNSKMMSQGTGNVSAKTVSTKHCNSINLTITDVSYVPQLRCNLLSVTCLMDKGYHVITSTGRIQIPVLELNDVQNQIPVRRSERLKSKLMSVHLVNNVPNSYFEGRK
ncbi:retrovirus-related Pol polyprotein from transposon TNT 1-94 [Trichonephila clavipes]|nr:retrovirus-related Pol polyprotein from transposon TNT 1-94 [Trichonephila clavipes]